MDRPHTLLHPPEPRLAELLRSTPGQAPFPTRACRDDWRALAGSPLAADLLPQAAQIVDEPIPPILATEILAFSRTGEREPSERPLGQRRARLAALVLAECLEGSGRFLDPALDAIWATCEESTWLYAAHLGRYRSEELPDPELYDIDLGVAGTALALAEADHLLGQVLHPAVRRRLRYEVERRVLGPFLARDDFWWLGPQPGRDGVNNWTAVCVAGVVGAALYLEEDPARLAAIIAKGLEAMGHYLATFAPDGGTAEGLGYWGYGFSHYALLSHLLECRTGGAVTLFDDPLARQSARFPLRVELSPGAYVPFSDVPSGRRAPDDTLAYLACRLEEWNLLALSARQGPPPALANRSLPVGLRHLAWLHDLPPLPTWQPSPSDWIAGPDWLVARYCPADPQALVLAAKGGHNGESHNHNDLGQFVVHWRGESLVTDLGAARYTRDFFRPEHRYQHPAASSYGHAVPAIDGQGQLPGPEHRAEVVHRVASGGEDTVVYELRAAYPAGLGLERLRRTVSLQRLAPHGRVVVVDELVARQPRRLESALITLGRVDHPEPGLLRLPGERGALQVRYDPDAVRVRVDTLAGVDLDAGPADVRRVALVWPEPQRQGAIRLEIVPE